MITDDDVKKLKTVFATKEDLNESKIELKGDVQLARIDLADAILQNRNELQSFKEEFRNGFKEQTSRILEAIDSFAGEIKDHRTNQVIHQNQHDKIIERFDKIEKIPVIAHDLKN